MLVTSYFRCSTAPQIAVEAGHHRARPDVDVHLQLPDARRAARAGLSPQPCAGSSVVCGSPVTRTREYEFHFS